LSGGCMVAQGTPEEMKRTTSEDVRQFMAGLPDGPVRFHYPAADYADELIKGGGA
jgi:phospholipid/cholesterol/gamma-HCH transport system ATP-binding protein